MDRYSQLAATMNTTPGAEDAVRAELIAPACPLCPLPLPFMMRDAIEACRAASVSPWAARNLARRTSVLYFDIAGHHMQFALPGLNVLVVEDDPIIALDIEQMLVDAGATVVGPPIGSPRRGPCLRRRRSMWLFSTSGWRPRPPHRSLTSCLRRGSPTCSTRVRAVIRNAASRGADCREANPP
jgi:hypothetical protein